MTLQDLLGNEFVDKSGAKYDIKRLSGKTVGIYFSAHWCPPCRGFTPKLAELYEELSKKHPFEIVFVSSDKDQASFDEYLSEMPWVAVPYSDRELKGTLSSTFKVRGIPSLVIVDSDGKTITTKGREVVTSDPEGFPWIPPTLQETLGTTFRKTDNETASAKDLEGKVLGIYFSASWCPPCKGFTPKLVEAYNKLTEQNKNFEVIFVSGDRDEESFKGYHGKMPWLAIPYDDQKRIRALNSHFEVEGIPHLVILDTDRSVISERAVAAVASGGAEEFPWHPKPLMGIEDGAEFLNDEPCVVALMEGCDDPTQDSAKAVLLEFAKKYTEEAKAKGESPAFRFMFASEEDPISSQIRKLTGLKTPEEEPELLIMNIPDNGGYYTLPAQEVTNKSVEEFLTGFTEKTLTRKQLGQ